MDKPETVVVLGASPNPERYSYQAVQMLTEHGHRAIPVHPTATEIAGIGTVHSLQDIAGEVDTLAMYVNPERSAAMAEEILGLGPRRIIFNPGTENPDLVGRCREQGIAVTEACTLVLLRTGQFGIGINRP
jgi:predicted CoA-binding protein